MNKIKFIGFLVISLFLLCRNEYVYAEKSDTTEFGFSGCYVTMEDIYALNEAYQNNPEMKNDEAEEFLMKRAKTYQEGLDYRIQSEGSGIGVLRIGDDMGYIDYMCYPWLPDSSYAGDDSGIYLYAAIGSDFCSLAVSQDELKEFIERNNQIKDRYREVCRYARNNLQDNEYAGVSINDENIPVVLLAEESRADELEKQGIAWEFCEKTRADMYGELQYLWQNREALQLVNVFSNQYAGLEIYGLMSEEEFTQNVPDAKLAGYYYEKEFSWWYTDEKLTEIEDVSELEDLSLFLLSKKCDARYLMWGDEFWEEMRVWMEQMRNIYPSYSYENLFSLGYLSREEGYYTEFDSELEDFVNLLPYTENKKNPFDENAYGDTEYLVLKVLLEKYKMMYPTQDYGQLYNTYVREIHESSVLTQEEKRDRYSWKIMEAEKKLENRIASEKNTMPLTLAGCVVLVFGTAVMTFVKNGQLRRK